jgi:hypothetical protein
MEIANLPESELSTLKALLRAHLDQFPVGLGGARLEEMGINPTQIEARGAIAEAQLGLEDMSSFLEATDDTLDALFPRWRVFLFGLEKVIGSVGLLRTPLGEFEVEHVTLGGWEEIVKGLKDLEDRPESQDSEARLIQIPRLYLSALALIRNGRFVSFRVLTPPYPQAVAAESLTQFRQLLDQLVEENRKIFPPA